MGLARAVCGLWITETLFIPSWIWVQLHCIKYELEYTSKHYSRHIECLFNKILQDQPWAPLTGWTPRSWRTWSTPSGACPGTWWTHTCKSPSQDSRWDSAGWNRWIILKVPDPQLAFSMLVFCFDIYLLCNIFLYPKSIEFWLSHLLYETENYEHFHMFQPIFEYSHGRTFCIINGKKKHEFVGNTIKWAGKA